MITVIGCGNPVRADDGVGVWVVQQLLPIYRDDAQVRVLDAGTSGTEVLFQARGSDALIIVDAAESGSQPGQIFEVPGAELANAGQQRPGAHGFRWDHALYAGRAIFGKDFPAEKVSVFLVEALDLAFGMELSEPVATAALRVVPRVRQRIESYRPCAVQVSDGNIFVSGDLYRRHFEAIAAVGLVRSERQVCIFPLRKVEHGGLLLKQRNASGDRIVHAQGFFRDNGLNDAADEQSQAVWDIEKSALVMNVDRLVI